MSSNGKSDGQSITKLAGAENYHTWQYAMTNVLAFHGLSTCIVDPLTETDSEKLSKAKCRIVMAVHESIFVHIENATNSSEMWKILKTMYEDHGLSRKIGLLRQLIGVRLENSESMSDYLDQIVGTSNKLNGTGFNVGGEMLGAIMLAGLTDEFKPFIMGLESSGVEVTADKVKGKLLDGNYGKSNAVESAFLGTNNGGNGTKAARPNKSVKKFKPKCYNCGNRGHIVKDCKEPKKSDDSPQKRDLQPKKRTNAFNVDCALGDLSKSNEWYIDSGASRHMTSNADLLSNMKKSSITEITAANDSKMAVSACGSIELRIGDECIEVRNVLLVPKLKNNLLSVSQIVANGNSVVFNADGCNVYNGSNEFVVSANASNGTYASNIGR